MFCPKCGKQLRDGAKFCGGCGNPINAPAAPVVAAPVVETPAPAPVVAPVVEAPVAETPAVETPAVETPVVETPVVETPAPAPMAAPVEEAPTPAPVAAPVAAPAPKKAKKKGKGVLIAIIVVVLLAGLGVGGWFLWQEHQNSEAYAQAEALIAEKKYDEAQEIFDELDDYEDASKRVKELKKLKADYEAALQELESGIYHSAYESFLALGDYADSAERAEEAKTQRDLLIAYNEAMDMYNTSRYQEAAEAFAALGEYQDSAYMVRECLRSTVMVELWNDNFEGAIAAYDKLPEDLKSEIWNEFFEFFPDQYAIKDLVKSLHDRLDYYEWDADEDVILEMEINALRGYTGQYFYDARIKQYIEKYVEALEKQLDTYRNGTLTEWFEAVADYYKVLEEFNKEYHLLDDEATLQEEFLGQAEYWQQKADIERSMNAWYDGLETIEYDETAMAYFLSFTDGSGHSYGLELIVTYYDDYGNEVYTYTGTVDVEPYGDYKIVVEIPAEDVYWRYWDVEWDFALNG